MPPKTPKHQLNGSEPRLTHTLHLLLYNDRISLDLSYRLSLTTMDLWAIGLDNLLDSGSWRAAEPAGIWITEHLREIGIDGGRFRIVYA